MVSFVAGTKAVAIVAMLAFSIGLLVGMSIMEGESSLVREQGAEESIPGKLRGPVTINGAGATFPFPLIDKWRVEYSKINPNVNINYQSIGSGGGIKQFSEKTVDFGSSDAPLTREQFEKLNNPLQIPETLGAVTVAYNVLAADGNAISSGLKLNPDVLADIFLGEIKSWNDQRVVELNPDLNLPDKGIVVVHRSDGSGTTFVFTDYLSRASDGWKERVGTGKAVEWPVGIGAAGNEGVAAIVRSTPYTIGYVELAYATQTDMPVAAIQNRAGEFVLPSLESTKIAAANAAGSLPEPDEDWSEVSIVDAPGEGSYPIASFSYLLLYKDLSTIPNMTYEKGQVLVDFLYWALTEGQKFASELQYVPLPDKVVKMDIEALRKLHFKERPFSIPR